MKDSLKTWLISALLLATMPEVLFAPDYGKAMKMYQNSRQIGKEFLNFLLIVGILVGAFVLIIYAKRWWLSRKDPNAPSPFTGKKKKGKKKDNDWDFDEFE